MLEAALGIITGIATVAIAYAALRQLPLIEKQVRSLAHQIELTYKHTLVEKERERIRRSVAAVERHDSDVVFDAAAERVYAASEQGKDYSKANKRDLIIIVNFYSGLSIGIKQEIYDETIIKDHLSSGFKRAVEKILRPGLIDEEEHSALISVYNDWFPPADLPEFRAR